METTTPSSAIENEYEQAARWYARSHRVDRFAETVSQGTQRKITLKVSILSASSGRTFRYSTRSWSSIVDRANGIGHVVPDNMVIICQEPIQALGSFDLSAQPVGPMLILDYALNNSSRKDYDDNLDRYEQELDVPYYLLFYPDTQDLTLYQNAGKRFQSVKPNENGRLAIPQLEMEAALLDGWVRFWFRGELLPLPGDLLFDLDKTKHLLAEAQARAQSLEEGLVKERLARAEIELELRQLRATLGNGNKAAPDATG